MLRIIIIILVYTGNNNASHMCVAYVLDWRRGGPWSTLRHPNPGTTYNKTDSASNIKILHIQYMMWPFYFSDREYAQSPETILQPANLSDTYI
jgi:hypothetical protein